MGGVARVGVDVMVVNASWKAVIRGQGEVCHADGFARRRVRKGSRERAPRESMKEATKAAGARTVVSGRDVPPAEAGRRSWKAVSVGESVRRMVGSRRRMEATARMAEVLAACARGVSVGEVV